MIANALACLVSSDGSHRMNSPGGWQSVAGARTHSGVTVTAESSLSVSTVLACVRRLSETLAVLPMHVCRVVEDFDKPDRNHPLWSVLHDRPNVWQNSFEWRELMMVHLLLRGNFYCRIVPGERGSVDQLVPLNPDRMRIEQLPGGRLLYHYSALGGERDTYTQDEIFHVRGLSLDGVNGVSVIHHARHAVGLSIAEETAGGKVFENGGVFLYALETEKKLGDEGRKNLRASWRGVHSGAAKSHNPPVLEDGLKIHELGMSMEDSQWIEARKFQAVEICQFFLVPPHMVGILDQATNNNIEQQSLEFILYTMLAWCKRVEAAAERDLIQDEGTFVVRFNVDGLLRGDIASRYAAYNTGIMASFLTVNEVRRRENLPPVPGGDERRVPLNTGPAGETAAAEKAAAMPPKKVPPVIEPEEEDDSAEANAEASRMLTPQVRDGFAVLIEDAAARIAAAEVKGLRTREDKAAADRSKFDMWTNEFYAKHEDYIIKTLGPIALAWSRISDRSMNVDGIASGICYAGVHYLSEAGDIPAVLSRWSESRAVQLATDLKERFFRVAA